MKNDNCPYWYDYAEGETGGAGEWCKYARKPCTCAGSKRFCELRRWNWKNQKRENRKK